MLELEVMEKMDKELDKLDIGAKGRALAWLMKKTADELLKEAEKLKEADKKFHDEKIKQTEIK